MLIADQQPSSTSDTMAFRTAASMARRMMSTSAVRSSEMSFTFGGPNAVFYNAAAVKQVHFSFPVKLVIVITNSSV